MWSLSTLGRVTWLACFAIGCLSACSAADKEDSEECVKAREAFTESRLIFVTTQKSFFNFTDSEIEENWKESEAFRDRTREVESACYVSKAGNTG